MSTSSEPAVAAPEKQEPRLGKILRWSARLTSVPILALVLTSLIPALGSYTVSARDDRIIALGLCGTAAGLLASWRWAAWGGGIILAGVAVILSQGDSLLNPDPFAVAFGLQGVLFLISGAVNSAHPQAGGRSLKWLKLGAAAALAICALAGAASLFRGPAPTPVPKDKQSYVGLWESGTGFVLEITAEGRAKVSQETKAKVEAWNSPTGGAGTNTFLVNFRGDDSLELSSGMFGNSKIYHIDRPPRPEAKQVRLVLNGSDPYKRNGGMALLKKR